MSERSSSFECANFAWSLNTSLDPSSHKYEDVYIVMLVTFTGTTGSDKVLLAISREGRSRMIPAMKAASGPNWGTPDPFGGHAFPVYTNDLTGHS